MKIETHRAASWRRKQLLTQIQSKIKFRKILSLQASSRRFFPQKRKIMTQAGVRALPCVFQKASLTVEAALSLPLFLLAMLTLLSLSGLYKAQVDKLEALEETAEAAAMIGYGTGASSDSKGEYTGVYTYQPAITFLGLGKLRLCAVARIRPWGGYAGDLSSEDGDDSDEIVYVSDFRSVYHTHADCSYLDIQLLSVSKSRVATLRNDYGEKYTACDKCRGISAGGTVYVSNKGDHYHSSASCSGLKKSPVAVRVSEVKGLSECARCKKRD